MALDIGTEAVKALVFKKSGQSYYILGSALQYFDESKPFNNDKVILKVKEEVVKQSKTALESLLLSPPAGILKSRVSFQNIVRQAPKKIIDKKEGQDIMGRIRKEIEKKVAEYDIKFVGFEVLEMKIDGYEVPALAGYRGKNVELRILTSFLPKDYFNDLNKLVKKIGLKVEKMVNPIKNLAGALKISQGIFLDIGGKITQICLVRNSKIEMIGEFAAGGRDFSRAISKTLGINESEARDFKERYALGSLTKSVNKRTKEILAGSVREWSFSLKSKLKSAKGFIPSDFFIFGGSSLLPDIRESIGLRFDEVGQGRIKLKLIHPKDFKNIIDGMGKANSPQYINSILLMYG